MNILYCGDTHMKRGLVISILSLLRRSSAPLKIFILTADMASDTRHFSPLSIATARALDRLVKQTNPANQVTRIDVTNLVRQTPPTANRNTIFTPCCMLRLYADQVPELPDRLLYLDTDVICRQDPTAMYQQDLTSIEYAGVLDHYGRWLFHRRWLHLDYVNSGILLLNLAEIRRTKLFVRSRQLCQVQEMFMPDQSALHHLVTHQQLLPRRYNEQRRLHDETVFQHFTTSFRFFPWIHTLTVKPWDVTAMHDQLKLHEYDDILADYQKIMVNF